ncbi:hypothetical protein [Brachybacterium saurashtrense]|uniref:hypothetical protein n=1 Tax=Brachybacterium saurashtrense TaxID=556288 RepID=UPI000F8EDDDC|nr:hypothetical protein [Brachybacterium saurashtrense]
MTHDPTDGAAKSLLQMKFDGGRFERNAFPASALAEVSRLSRLFVALAEDLWRADHPDRVRVPKGFGKRFELFLSDVAPGSAIPVLGSAALIEGPVGHLDIDGTPRSDRELAAAAASAVSDAFISIVRNGALPDGFPEKAKREVSHLFSSLDPSEYPVFWGHDGEEYDYTFPIRSTFVDSLAPGSRMGTGQVAGRLSGVDADGRIGHLRMADGSVVSARYLPDLFEDFREALAMPGHDTHVVLSGSYLVKDNRISELVSVDEISAVQLPSGGAGNRLLELMTDDLDGECDTVTPELAEVACEVLAEDNVPEGPAIFPVEDGGVQLVWRGSGVRTTVTITDVDSISARRFNRFDRSATRYWEWTDLGSLKAEIGGVFGA